MFCHNRCGHEWLLASLQSQARYGFRVWKALSISDMSRTIQVSSMARCLEP